MDNLEYIRSRLDSRTALEQIAEESAELSQAALKVIRAMEISNNPTPVSKDEAIEGLLDETADVMAALVVLEVIDPYMLSPRACKKLIRWADRLREAEKQ